MPFSSSGPASSTTRLAAASRYAVGPTRISPGRAALWRRDARLTASPVANVDSEPSTTTSPASIPIRACELEVVDRFAHGERRSRGSLRVVLVRLRDAERGHDGVAGELLDDAAVLRHALRDRLEELRSRGAERPPDRFRSPAVSSRRCRRTAPLRACAPRVKCRNDDGGAVHPGVPSSIPSVLDPSVFKAYDVRGLYPSQLDEDGAYRVARAYAQHFEPRAVALGRDMRLSSPAMLAAAAEGIADAGADVVDLGLVGTEMLYHAVTELGLDGGICVTASHNPKEYTGMKIVRRGALPVGGDSGLAEIRALAEADFEPVGGRGTVRTEDVWESYVAKVLSFVDVAAVKPLRVVVDAANGMAGVMLPPVLEHLPQLEVVRCHFDPDGTFPNHEPNPLLPENREFIVAKVTEESADLGVAYDGDADRCFFVDDTGEFVPGDFATALMAEAVLADAPGEKVIYDVRASWGVPEAIERAGGIPLVNRVGHAFIKQRMRAEDAVFGGEVSAHYYFREFSQADTGVVPFLVMLGLLSRSGAKLSELLRPYRERFFLTGEINTPVADVPLKLQELKERYTNAGGRASHLDGLSIDFDDWHFNVRPSNTEPLLRLNLEALSEPLMVERRDEVLAVIRS